MSSILPMFLTAPLLMAQASGQKPDTVYIEQYGSRNAVRVEQPEPRTPADVKLISPPAPAIRTGNGTVGDGAVPPDYQKEILNNPAISDFGKAQKAISGADPAQLSSPPCHGLDVKQQGQKNSQYQTPKGQRGCPGSQQDGTDNNAENSHEAD